MPILVKISSFSSSESNNDFPGCKFGTAADFGAGTAEVFGGGIAPPDCKFGTAAAFGGGIVPVSGRPLEAVPAVTSCFIAVCDLADFGTNKSSSSLSLPNSNPGRSAGIAATFSSTLCFLTGTAARLKAFWSPAGKTGGTDEADSVLDADAEADEADSVFDAEAEVDSVLEADVDSTAIAGFSISTFAFSGIESASEIWAPGGNGLLVGGLRALVGTFALDFCRTGKT